MADPQDDWVVPGASPPAADDDWVVPGADKPALSGIDPAVDDPWKGKDLAKVAREAEGAAPVYTTQGVDYATPRGSPAQPAAPRDVNTWQHLLESFENTQRGIGQGTNPNVYHGDGTYLRPVLGEVSGMTDENLSGLMFKGPGGTEAPVDTKAHVVLRDPVDGKLKVFKRDSNWDEGALNSISRFIMQGMGPGPATGVARTAAGQAPSRTSSIMAAERAAEATRDADAFSNLGIRGFGPAFSQGPVRAIAKQLSETAFIGAPVRNALEESITGTRNAAEALAGRYGSAATADEVGQIAQQGLERYKDARPMDVVEQGFRPPAVGTVGPTGADFTRHNIIAAPARETSLKTKQAALYDRAWSLVPDEMRGGRTVADTPRYLGGLGETQTVINEIVDRNLGMINKARAARQGTTSARDVEQITALGDQVAQAQQVVKELRRQKAPQEMIVEQSRVLDGLREELRVAKQGRLSPEGDLLPTVRDAIPKVALPVQGGMLGQIVEDVASGKWRGTLQNMRDVRSDVRRLASGMSDTEKNTLRMSDMERIQSAVTRDMVNVLQRNANEYRALAVEARNGQNHTQANLFNKTAADTERAIREFRRADTFTRLSMERLERIENLFQAKNATALYRNVAQAALGGTKGDVDKLRVLRRTLRPEEMDQLAAYTLREMGRPVPSARDMIQEIGFSPSTFMTKLNPNDPARAEALQLIFGQQHANALNDLGRVVRRIANVEAMGNTSRSATNAMNLGSLIGGGGMLATGAWKAALGSALTGFAAAIILSRPSYVRWATTYANLRSQLGRSTLPTNARATLVNHIERLGQMARADAQLLPVYRAIAAENGVQEGSEQQQ